MSGALNDTLDYELIGVASIMNTTAKLTSLLGASLLVAFASAAPAEARAKPCCRNDGQFFNTSTSTCRHNGGRVVDQQYCQGYGYDSQYDNRSRYDDRSGNGGSFSITLGNVVIGYSDGYYDRDRRWHGWRNDNERNWYQQNHRDSYYQQGHDDDRDQNRRDWRDGRRQDWH
jgi:hypothetical protein